MEAGAVYVSNSQGKTTDPDILFDNVTFINNTAKSLSPSTVGDGNNRGGGAVQVKESYSVYFTN